MYFCRLFLLFINDNILPIYTFLLVMKSDIKDRKDIIQLIDAFYVKVKQDELIGHFFTEVVQLSWEKHMPVMYNFWESVLFGKAMYKGNPILKHIELDQKSNLTKAHFHQWKSLFNETVDEHFSGEKAAEAKKRVELMEQLMLYKIESSRNNLFIQ